ncbi:hypothetical protein EON81_18975, partial [bacterium]
LPPAMVERLADQALDLGPKAVGIKVGERGFLLAINVDLSDDDLSLAKRIAREIRTRREAGEEGFAGVRALAFPLPSRGIVQVSMNLTDPDRSCPDEMVRFVEERAGISGTELIGVIRERDLPGATRLPIDSRQIWSADYFGR